jgi:accessory gene regulator B
VIHELAVKLANRLGEELQQQERVTVIAYGLELLLGSMVKLVCFIIIPLLLGILPLVLAAFLTSAAFRLVAGGAHCTAYYRCLIGSLATFTGAGFLARWLAGTGLDTREMALAGALFAFLVAMLWAPASTPAKPISREGHRRVLKAISLLLPTVYLVAVYLLPIRRELLAASTLGLAFQSFTVTPAGYRFMEWLDIFLSRLHSILIPGKGGVKNAA